MAFNDLKTEAGQQIASIIDIELDRCRYTTDQLVSDGALTADAGVTDVYTGVLAVSGGDATSFDLSNPYILWDSEIIKVNVNSGVELNITARGQFGTIAAAHSAGSIKLMHSGEADGTCYATPQTCSSPDSYDSDSKLLLRFPSSQLDLDERFYNGFDSWSHTPVKVDPGQSIGRRASVSASLLDSVDLDLYIPYTDRRTSNGTLFSKLLERHPYMKGRPVKIHTGFDPLNLDFNNFITREYLIDSVQLNGGKFSLSCLDPLILADDKTSKAPLASAGTLAIAIDDLSTEITFTSAPAFDYGSSGTVWVRIDSEVIETTVNTDFTLTIVNRAVGGTEQKDHNINATIQLVLVYQDVNVVEIIEDLITNYTPIHNRFLDDYTAVKAATSSILLTAFISKSTAVKTLLDELVKNGDLTVYFDEENQKIRIKQVQDVTAQPISINEDDHIKRNSFKSLRLDKEQYTRYPVAWAPNDITKDRDEENFSIVYTAINLNNELPKNIGETNEKKIFFNRWLTDDSGDVIIGTSIAQRVIDRSEQMPEEIQFILDVESVFNTQGGVLEPGSIINVATSRRVNVDGSPRARNYQVLSMKDNGKMNYLINARYFQDPIENITVDFVIDENKENYDLSTEFAPVAGAYVILIDTGVEIGSTSTAIPAFTTGAQAAGVSLTIINRGAILGAGGAGGDGGLLIIPNPQDQQGSFFQVGTDGLVGGIAFETTVPVTINTGSGAIWAGGGGGAGEASGGFNVPLINGQAGNGGCGGQGYQISFGGEKGRVTSDSSGFIDDGQDGVNGGRQPGTQGQNFGGEWGEQGYSENGGAEGGLSGFAIVSNGNSVTIDNGDNPLNIKGRRS